jgi:predicted RNA polymerase sigma factor
MFGLAEALAKLHRLPEAEEAYRKCIDIDAQSQIAAVAREERRKFASR